MEVLDTPIRAFVPALVKINLVFMQSHIEFILGNGRISFYLPPIQKEPHTLKHA
jgi:hypothetical protein